MLRFVEPVGATGGCLLYSGNVHVASVAEDPPGSWRWFMISAIDPLAWQSGFGDAATAAVGAHYRWLGWLAERGLEPGNGPDDVGCLDAVRMSDNLFDIRLQGHRIGRIYRKMDLSGGDSDAQEYYSWRLAFPEVDIDAGRSREASVEESLRSAEFAWNGWLRGAGVRYCC